MKLFECELTTDTHQEIEVLYGNRYYKVTVQLDKYEQKPYSFYYDYDINEIRITEVYDNEGNLLKRSKEQNVKDFHAIFYWLEEQVKELN